MKRPFISVIVPTLNEGKYIEQTLKALRNQDYEGKYEIIVADSHSKDNTLKIAGKYADKVILVRKRGVAIGRNLGASKAKGDVIVFMNADVYVQKNLLNVIAKKMKGENVIGGVCVFKPLDGNVFDKFLFFLGNLLSWISINIKGDFLYAPAECLFCSKEEFLMLKGFREDLIFCEDHDFAKRLGKIGKFIYLNTPVYISLRRYKKLGYMKAAREYIISTLFYALTGKIPENFSFEPVR